MNAVPNVIPMPCYGATQADWAHFTLLLGLTADLLPVVSNPNAEISADSKMKEVGKTPSRYNGHRKVAGIADWTHHTATDAEIDSWAKQRDYGICLQTRTVRALDCDISDAALAERVGRVIAERVGRLPCRMRNNANKFLLAFTLSGDMPKRVIKTAHGNIEFLATGQQFIAVGTHPSGARYEWTGGLPDEFPILTRDQFEDMWSLLASLFAIEPPVEGKTSTKAQQLADAAQADPMAKYLLDNGWVKSTERDGRLHIACPWESEHTTESADSATSYFPAHTGGYENGHFRCLHAHCEHRKDEDFRREIGVSLDDFEVVVDDATPPEPAKVERFRVVPAAEFAVGKPLSWIVRGVLPAAELAVVYGDSGSGKSFLMLDIGAAVARGREWRGKRVKQGKVVYIAAEGAGGFRNRLKAYAHQHQVDLAQLDVGVIGDAPNMMKVDDVKALIAAIKAFGTPSVVVVDTFAQVMPGANENAGEDVGKALAHCKAIHKATGALVVLVHHSGKDATRGARGWSGLRAAADAEVEVSRADDDRVATITKIKDGEGEGVEFGFRLQTVTVDVDEEGDDITSCVVEHCEAVPKAQRKKEPKGSNERIVMRVVSELMQVGEDDVSASEVISVAVDQLVAPDEGKRDKRGEHIKRAIESLVAGGQLVKDGMRLKFAGGDEQ